MVIQSRQKFFRGQRVFVSEAASADFGYGYCNIEGIIRYSYHDLGNTDDKSHYYDLLLLGGRGNPERTKKWYREEHLSLVCVDRDKGEQILQTYQESQIYGRYGTRIDADVDAMPATPVTIPEAEVTTAFYQATPHPTPVVVVDPAPTFRENAIFTQPITRGQWFVEEILPPIQATQNTTNNVIIETPPTIPTMEEGMGLTDRELDEVIEELEREADVIPTTNT